MNFTCARIMNPPTKTKRKMSGSLILLMHNVGTLWLTLPDMLLFVFIDGFIILERIKTLDRHVGNAAGF